MLKEQFIKVIILGMTIYLAGGCGYQLEQGGLLGKGVSSVSVPVFGNDTVYPYVGVVFSNAFIQEIMEKTTTKVPQGQEVPYRIKAIVKKISFLPMVRDADETVRQQRITAWVDIELVSAKGKILWTAKDMTANEEYILSMNDSHMQAGRRQEEEDRIRNAIGEIAQKIAEKAVKAMKENF